MTSSTDRIEREILLKAPRSRVWRALSNAEEFGNWFGMDLKGKTFEAGKTVHARITYPGYEHLVCEMVIERIEPEKLLSWRWHPGAIDPAFDYSGETRTLVVFELEEVDSGTLVRLVETGFDDLPPARRLDAFRLNSGGWETQMENIEKHVATG
ncbi:vanillate O-demethylase oxidoreductase VanB [Caballeronia mineralivorans PML1(12)]|uniref:Vanillate O-demethylase oxidoreductase VanB n=1 Tax=Caballeronia mineralivorans PML1(12) TaxID=908627 RepID=A0A0J1CV89_9BURK|nr:SRPBCC family protein [Caballeronia mineralivorans]KLU24515.1 vanillate O-demethylase oxidoreductase VanB [Caballeronia mineralivorans PML1(12)]